MKRSDLKTAITELRATAENLQKYYDETKKKHKKLNDGNGTYDPIEYWACHAFIHLGILRSKMNLRKSFEGADGEGKKCLVLHDGSFMNCYLLDDEQLEYYNGLRKNNLTH